MGTKLSTEAIKRIQHKNNRHVKNGLQKETGFNRITVWRLLKNNNINSALTLDSVVRYLQEELNMSRESLLTFED